MATFRQYCREILEESNIQIAVRLREYWGPDGGFMIDRKSCVLDGGMLTCKRTLDGCPSLANYPLSVMIPGLFSHPLQLNASIRPDLDGCGFCSRNCLLD